jgi:hypothetical protein
VLQIYLSLMSNLSRFNAIAKIRHSTGLVKQAAGMPSTSHLDESSGQLVQNHHARHIPKTELIIYARVALGDIAWR